MLLAQIEQGTEIAKTVIRASEPYGFGAIAFTMGFTAICGFTALWFWKISIPQSISRIETRIAMTRCMQEMRLLLELHGKDLASIEDKLSAINHKLGLESKERNPRTLQPTGDG